MFTVDHAGEEMRVYVLHTAEDIKALLGPVGGVWRWRERTEGG